MPAASRTSDLNRKAFHWATDGAQPVIQDVVAYSTEAHAIQGYFYKRMPRDAEVTQIRRIENRNLFVPYKAYRESIKLSCADCPEMWLWHGTDANAESLCMEGISTSHSSLVDNFYGAGNYFAIDPRLAAHFEAKTRGRDDRRSLILARVVVGRCGVRPAIKRHQGNCRCTGQWTSPECASLRQRELRQPENRRPPDGCHSATSKHRLEVIVYQDCHCYPAYVIEYTSPSLAWFGNPYEEPQKSKLDWFSFDSRAEHQVNFEVSRERLVQAEDAGCMQCGSDGPGYLDHHGNYL